jgi:serine/threonine protein kinase
MGRLRATDSVRPQQNAPSAPQAENANAQPELIAGRYRVQESIGRGGMASVYRVLDSAGGAELALKRLETEGVDADRRNTAEALFESEFQTLTQLHHPRVIQVYDYGIDEGRAYYTMELLDGGDLAEHSPLPWPDASRLIYEVCSSLALLHSRRLVHRDVSPRNIRRTRDGRPKLIDFGAMCSMGQSHQPVGTPAFVAPEVVQRARLDGRTDLFSLGATLYYALTGRPAFPARSFAQLHEVWSNKPAPASSIVAGIPPALDDLIASLISLEPALRPRSAFEVMQRLAAIADIESSEPLGVLHAYLATPTLLGRDELLSRLKRRVSRASNGLGTALMLEGPPGIGRSRALDASVLLLKTSGITTLRAGGKHEQDNFELAGELAQQLLESLPEQSREALEAEGVRELLLAADGDGMRLGLQERAASSSERARLNDALSRWFMRVARSSALAIAADDVDHADDASLLFLATLAQSARRHRLLVLTSAEQRGPQHTPKLSLHVLRERSESLELTPLTAAETERLFDSVFGDVPHVALLSDRVQRVALGNPKRSMELAQHLVDQGVIVYDAGTWTLPAELEQAALPSSMEATFVQRLSGLSPLARQLAECHALSTYRDLTRDDHRLLAGSHAADETTRALRELVEHELLLDEGQRWKLAQPGWRPLILRGLDDAQLREYHRALGELPGKPELPTLHHVLCAGQHERGLQIITNLLAGSEDTLEQALRTQVPPRTSCELLERCLPLADAASNPSRLQSELRRWICIIGTASDDEFYLRHSPLLLAQLRRDSGLDDWQSLAAVGDAGQRLTQALTAAAQRHAATPEHERVYPVDAAIKQLVIFVAVSIAVGARALYAQVLRSLPDLLEPFATLSPVIDAMWHNAIATRETSCDARFFQARERWLNVLERLNHVDGDALRYVNDVRYAIMYALGCLEAGRGFPTAEHWAKQLDNDPRQKVAGMYLRKVARLQLGDWEGAEHFRREAELAALQADATQLLAGSHVIELGAHAMASDLPGVRQIAARVAAVAEKSPGWKPQSLLAGGYFELLRGNPTSACQLLEQALALCAPDPNDPHRVVLSWPGAAGAYVHALIELGRVAEARAYGERTLREAERLGVQTMDDVVRGTALAETRLGDYPTACVRLQSLIDRQLALDVTGLHLGASYEARARIAILAGDRDAVETYGRMTAEQYRHGRGSPLGARYETLMSEARRAGVQVLPALSNFETQVIGLTEMRGAVSSTFTLVSSALRSAADHEQRNKRALELICQAYAAEGGQLYLLRKQRLERVASTGPHAAGDAQLEIARRCIDQAMHEDEIATELVSDTSDIGSAAMVWTTHGSLEHRSLPISTMVDGELQHLGVIVMVAPERTASPEAVATLSAVARMLAE